MLTRDYINELHGQAEESLDTLHKQVEVDARALLALLQELETTRLVLGIEPKRDTHYANRHRFSVGLSG